jgi:hypothetical protein
MRDRWINAVVACRLFDMGLVIQENGYLFTPGGGFNDVGGTFYRIADHAAKRTSRS